MKLNSYHPKEWKLIPLRELTMAVYLCDRPEAVAEYWPQVTASPMWNARVENMVVIMVNCRRRIQGHFVVANGTLDMVFIHPREVFAPAIVANAAAIILVHNHPSGDPSPSEADIKVTRDLIAAGKLLKIDVLDHVIMGQMLPGFIRPFCSLREAGYFA